jgi:hypothetical protein
MRAIITIIALCTAVAASGQIYIDSYRFGTDLLLNQYGGAAAAYSLRKLDKNYTGNVIMVSRSSDGDSLNVGFLNNYLDTAFMKSFCGTNASDSCKVKTWYDQSGNNNHARMDAEANRPIIMRNGLIQYDTVQQIAGLRFNGNTSQMIIQDAATLDVNQKAFFTVISAFSGGTTGNVVFAKRSSTEYSFDFSISRTTGNSFYGVNSNINRPSVLFNFLQQGSYLHYGNYDQINVSLAYNETMPINVAFASAVTNSSEPLYLGRRGGGFNFSDTGYFNGLITELIIYSSAQSVNRTNISTNINNFYSIY